MGFCVQPTLRRNHVKVAYTRFNVGRLCSAVIEEPHRRLTVCAGTERGIPVMIAAQYSWIAQALVNTASDHIVTSDGSKLALRSNSACMTAVAVLGAHCGMHHFWLSPWRCVHRQPPRYLLVKLILYLLCVVVRPESQHKIAGYFAPSDAASQWARKAN